MRVCLLGKLEQARYLLEKGANPNARNVDVCYFCTLNLQNDVFINFYFQRNKTPERKRCTKR
jgi:hypothetical protein